MAAPVLVIAGLKGGVGRTATAVNLAAMLALAKRHTLLIDLDPKGDATAGLGLPRREPRPAAGHTAAPRRRRQDRSPPRGVPPRPRARAPELGRRAPPPPGLLDRLRRPLARRVSGARSPGVRSRSRLAPRAELR